MLSLEDSFHVAGHENNVCPMLDMCRISETGTYDEADVYMLLVREGEKTDSSKRPLAVRKSRRVRRLQHFSSLYGSALLQAHKVCLLYVALKTFFCSITALVH